MSWCRTSFHYRFFSPPCGAHRDPHSFPTRRSSDLTNDVDEFVNAVRYLGASFGGINLEDIKAPECFIIEQRLRELMDIPVFQDRKSHTSELQSHVNLVCRLLLEKKNKTKV